MPEWADRLAKHAQTLDVDGTHPGGTEGPPGPAGPPGAVEVYEQPSEPASTNEGAIWIDSDAVLVPGEGPAGPAGPAGADGAVGPTGPAGAEGPAGPAGAEGPAGPAGADGVDGGLYAIPISGLWMSAFPMIGFGGAGITAGMMRVTRVVVPTAMQQAAFEVSSLGATTVKVVAFADTATGPGALVLESAAVDGSTTGLKQVAFALPAGTYWVGVQNVGTATVTLRYASGVNTSLTGHDLPTIPLAINTYGNCWQVSAQGTTVKNPFNNGLTTGIVRSQMMVAMFLQAV